MALTRVTGSLASMSRICRTLRDQRFRGERLGQEIDIGIEPAVMDDGVAGVAGGEQHLQVGPPPQRLVGELPSVHAAGQHHVGEQQLDIRIGVEQPQPARAFMRRDHLIAFVAQHFAREAVDLLVVLDQQDLFRMLRGVVFGVLVAGSPASRVRPGSRPSGAADRA